MSEHSSFGSSSCESFEASEVNYRVDGMDFNLVGVDEFSELERNSILGSSFASAFPRGSVVGQDFEECFREVEEVKESEKDKAPTTNILNFIK